MPMPLELALFTERFEAEVAAPFPSPSVVRALLAPLRWLAGRRGYGERYAPRPAVAV